MGIEGNINSVLLSLDKSYSITGGQGGSIDSALGRHKAGTVRNSEARRSNQFAAPGTASLLHHEKQFSPVKTMTPAEYRRASK